MSRLRRWAKRSILGLLALFVLLTGLSAWLNRDFFDATGPTWTMGERDEVLLREALHLRRELGDRVWPGWGEAELPVVVYNGEFIFLVGLRDPSDGWMSATTNDVRGGSWEPVPTDSFGGRVYYRQPIPGPGEDPQAFAVRVGDRWAASLQTYSRMRIALGERFRDALPWPLDRVFPYGLAARLFTGGGDGYVTLVAHEGFHAYQGTLAAERLRAAERATRYERSYPDGDAVRQAWHHELGLLASALEAEVEDTARALAGDFLDAREGRREEARMGGELIEYERQREWLEGLAKYAELRIWQVAAESPQYQPLREATELSDFRDYTTFPSHWSQQLVTMRRAERSEPGVRFYYSGMAQAFLLDRFRPDWKHTAFTDSVWLETLLESALSGG